MSQDVTKLHKRETSLLVYADEVCRHKSMRMHGFQKCILFFCNRRSIDCYLSKSRKEANYVMDTGWWPKREVC